MTPQEKAQELVDKYKNPFNRIGCIPPSETMFDSTTKQCALIAVDEIIKAPFENTYLQLVPDDAPDTDWFWDKFIEYWEQVKQEIEKL